MRNLAIATSFLVVVLCQTVPAQEHQGPPFPNAILGRWDMTIKGATDTYPSWLEVHLRTDDSLHAAFVGRFGSIRYASLARFIDGQLVVAVPVQYEDTKGELLFVGKLVGDDRLEGTSVDERGRPITWTAKRAPAAAPAKTVTWGSPVKLLADSGLAGWKQRSAPKGICWSVDGGVLSNTPPCSDLITEASFGDFKLHVELMYPAKSNSGIYLRGRHEVQIQDDFGKSVDSHRMGGVYGFLTPYVNAAKPAGEWQTYDITLVGRRVTVVLNGQTLLDNEIIPGITGGAIDSDEAAPGPLMLQGDHGKISYRNITITPAQ
jgi:hypothetical protein